MNEESIIYIINYFNQYKDQPPEVLVKNIISSGYNMTDLKEALRRMGISPIVIPRYKEVMPQPKQMYSKKLIIIFGAAVAVLLIGVSSFILLSPKKSSPPKTAEKIEPTVTNVPTPTSTPAPTIIVISPTNSASYSAQLSDENPASMMKDSFAKSDYKATIVSYRRDAGDNSPPELSQNIVFYLNKGVIKRFDSDHSIIIFTDQLMYALDKTSHTYDQDSFNNPQINNAYTAIQGVFLPNLIIKDSEINEIKWQKKSETIWEGTWNNPDSLFTSAVMTIDPAISLPTKISLINISANITHIEDSQLEYEKIPDFNSVLKLPEGYTFKPALTPTP